MATVAIERGAPVPTPDKLSMFERLKKALEFAFKKKLEMDAAEKFQHQRKEEERAEKRAGEKRKRDEKEKERGYHQRKSAEEAVENLKGYQQLEKSKVAQLFDMAVNSQTQDLYDRANLSKKGVVSESDYLFEPFRGGDTTTFEKLHHLIESNLGVAQVIETLATKKDVHRDPAELIKLSRNLMFEAKRAGGGDAVIPLVSAIQNRVGTLVSQAIELNVEEMRKAGRSATGAVPEWLISELKADKNQRETLRDEKRWQEAIGEMLDYNAVPDEIVEENRWTETTQEIAPQSQGPSKEFVANVSEIWSQVQNREKSGQPLTTTEIKDVERRLAEAESSAFPRDVQPGTKAFNSLVTANHKFVEDRLNALSEVLTKRLKTEAPVVKRGLTPQQFLETMGEYPGHLGQLFDQNPELKKLFLGEKGESVSFRNQVFLTIHKNVLTQRREESNQNFGLYERADFTTLINLLQSGLSKVARKETGLSAGQTWAEWYVGLSQTIRLSRDVDYWASQPRVSMEDFTRVLGIFQNEYSVQALTFPAVEQAYRAYETTLRAIQSANDGYIPPALIEHDYAHNLSYWDVKSMDMLKSMIDSGVVHDVSRDELGFHKVHENGHTVLLSDDPLDLKTMKEQDPQELELAMYMTLAKGFGVANLRFLEMFAHSKIPGSEHPDWGMEGFHSTAYEGVARAFDFFNTVIHKWKFGSYRYMYMMNFLLPEEKKFKWLSPTDSTQAKKVYIAYRDGTFEEEYGSDAKRLMDLTNFSNCSGAFGPPHTSWRHLDTSIGWSDQEKQMLGTSAQIMLRHKFSEKKIKEFLVSGKYREAFRQTMHQAGMPTSGPEFEKLWQSKGMPIYGGRIEKEWADYQKDHHKLEHIEELQENYNKAYVARVWVDAIMRNPLTVAHNVTIKVPNEGFENDPDPKKSKKKIKLHSLIVQEILGIPLEDLKYGVIPGSDGMAVGASPTEEQRRYMNEVISLETDLAAVREVAIKEQRHLTEADFYFVIRDDTRAKQAIRYWQMVKQVMIGSENPETLYHKFGLTIAQDGNFDINWEHVERIDSTLENLEKQRSGIGDLKLQLNSGFVGKEWEWMFSTDDTSYREMDILNLGSRHWLRRGGDAAAHFAGGQRAAKYLQDDLLPKPNPEDLAKALKEIRQAYEADTIDVGWRVAGHLGYLTSRLYSWDWKRMGSAAQLDVWHTRRNIAAWMANDRRKFWDTMEHLDVIPPVYSHGEKVWGYRIGKLDDIHELRRLNHADNIDVWIEIITLGMLLATALTIWRAITTKSEDEDEGHN